MEKVVRAMSMSVKTGLIGKNGRITLSGSTLIIFYIWSFPDSHQTVIIFFYLQISILLVILQSTKWIIFVAKTKQACATQSRILASFFPRSQSDYFPWISVDPSMSRVSSIQYWLCPNDVSVIFLIRYGVTMIKERWGSFQLSPLVTSHHLFLPKDPHLATFDLVFFRYLLGTSQGSVSLGSWINRFLMWDQTILNRIHMTGSILVWTFKTRP